jgi:CarD family transcriptional regulator
VQRKMTLRLGKSSAFKRSDKGMTITVAKKKLPANSNRKLEFKANDHVVYPTHGVGKIARVEEQEVAGHKLEVFVITFEKDKMTLRVPTAKAKAVGMRKLSSPDVVSSALNTLKGRARIKRTMWSRRAQEYEAKINSGDLVSIAEVVRDLHRASGQPEQSYSERQLYEAALARMARELAAVERIDEQTAVKRVEGALLKKAA